MTSGKTGLLFHYNTYLLPFIALNNERWCRWPLAVFGACSLTFLRWPLLCGVPSCGLGRISGIKLIFWTSAVESVHIQNLNLVPFLFLCVFHFLYDKKTLPEHYYLGPLDLFFLTPMKPEGQLCSGV